MAETRPSNDLTGSTIDDKIVIESVIAAGGMGVVYKARHKTFDKPVAVKVLSLASRWHDPTAVRRFRAEATALQQLDHPNIVKVFSFGMIPEGAPYLVLEFLNGGSLSDRLAAGSGPLEDCWDLLLQMAEGLAHAHANNLMHRDLKPSNIMFGEDGKLKLVDFGVAKSTEEGAAQKLTQTGNLVGTPLYMSPEALAGQQPTPAGDVYSLGCVMFECVYGRRYVEGDTLLDIAMKQAECADAPMPARSAGGEDVPDGLKALLRKVLNHDAANRVRDGGELLRVLKEVREQPHVVPTELVMRKRVQRKPLSARGVVGVVTMMLGLICAGFLVRNYLVHDDQVQYVNKNMLDAVQLVRDADPADKPLWHKGRVAVERAAEFAGSDPELARQVDYSLRTMARRLLNKHYCEGEDQMWILAHAAELPALDDEQRRMRQCYLAVLMFGAIEAMRNEPAKKTENMQLAEEYLEKFLPDGGVGYGKHGPWRDVVESAAALAFEHFARYSSASDPRGKRDELQKAIEFCEITQDLKRRGANLEVKWLRSEATQVAELHAKCLRLQKEI